MKKFSKYIEEMSMSVTLKPKKNNMYKVTGVGKKMAAHGGIKKGEKFHDSEIDGMHDSGIKVKYDKPKSPSMKKESSDSMQRMADTWNDHADHKDPKVQKHIKKAEKAYNDKDHEGFYHHTQKAADHAYTLKYKPGVAKPGVTQFDRNRKPQKEEMDNIQELSPELVNKVAHKRNVNVSMAGSKADYDRRDPDYQKAAAKQHKNQMLRFGRGAKAISKAFPKKPVGEEIVNELSKDTLSSYKDKATKDMPRLRDKMYQPMGKDNQNWKNNIRNLKKRRQGIDTADKKLSNEAIERRMDRKTIIATDPATGRKVVKVAPKKEIDIGKGKHESFGEKYNPHISMPNIGGKEYMKNLKKSIEKTTGHLKPSKNPGLYKNGKKVDVNEISDTTKVNYINKANKAITDREKLHLKIGAKVDKDKTLEKMRKGVAMAKSKLGEDKTPMQMYELKISTMQKYKQAAHKDVQDGENARHKGYPEKDIDKRQDKRYKGIDTANKRIDKKQVKMAKGVAFDKRYKGGNMTGASKAIDKIKPGLSDHPKVKSALRRANEEIGE